MVLGLKIAHFCQALLPETHVLDPKKLGSDAPGDATRGKHEEVLFPH